MSIYTDEKLEVNYKKLLEISKRTNRNILRIIFDDYLAVKPWRVSIRDTKEGNLLIRKYKGKGQYLSYSRLSRLSERNIRRK